MHRICNPCLDKKQKGSGGSSNQPKRRSPAFALLQQGASKKKASSASASRKRLTLAQKLEVLKLLDQKAYMDAQHKHNNETAVYHLEMPNYDEATHHVRSRTHTTT